MQQTTMMIARAALMAAVLGMGASCTQQVGDIDRTQPNALEKAFFEGEWYYQRTVVDMPAANGFTFVGSSDFNGMSIITWDIEEQWLFARRNIELIEGGDGKEREGEDYEGEVIAAFRIQGHFDIQRQYNAATGEQTNVVVENASDRPWHDRDFMRVDWSMNHVHNYQFDFEAASVEPIPYYVQAEGKEGEELHPDAPHFSDDEDYFDVTNKLFARAGTVEIEGFGTAPTCWLFGGEFDECGAGEYAIRHSFMRRDPITREYQPEVYKGGETNLFGFFWVDRNTYDGQEGVRVQNKTRFLTRHNLWRNWFAPGQRDVPVMEREVLPVSQRRLRPIVYHVNRDFPDGSPQWCDDEGKNCLDLRQTVVEVSDQWNEIFSDVVTEMGYELKEGERVFIGCPHNPVREGDHPACGVAGTSPRIGDIRYSFMAYVPNYMKYGLLGLGPSNNDPVTGEIYSGMAYMYHHNNTIAYDTARMIELLQSGDGSREVREFIDGVDIQEWAAEVRGDAEAPVRTYGLEDADHMVEQLANGWMTQLWEGRRRDITDQDRQFMAEHGTQAWVREQFETLWQAGAFQPTGSDGRLRNLRGTQIEDLMLHDEHMLAAHNHAPGAAPTEAMKNEVSVLRGGFGKLTRERQRILEDFAERNNMYLPEMADDMLMGLARRYEREGADFETIYADVRKAVYTAVFAHEVGHSLGLQHNFGGSDDVFNYFDRYWEIRDDGEVGPRTTDPITEAEIDAGIYEHAYSSIMDYSGRMTIDGNGVGKYDRAAILFGYAGLMEVFRDTGRATTRDLADWHESDGDVLVFDRGPYRGFGTIHYTTYYNQMGELMYKDDNRFLVPVESFSSDFSTAQLGPTSYTRVPYIYCSHASANLSDNCLTRDAGADPMERMSNILDDLNTWYIMRNFPRGRVGVDTSGYVGRYYGRSFNRLKNWNNLYALYVALLGQFFDANTMERLLTDARAGFGTKTWGVQNAFNYLVQTVLMPDVGEVTAQPSLQADGLPLAARPNAFGETIDIDISDGRYYSTDWFSGGRDCGYTWYECLHHIGFYFDKIMAIEALTDSSTNFVARATPLDIRQWEVSYYSTFPEQIAQINTAIMSQDYRNIGPYIQGRDVVFPNYAGDLSEAHAVPVDPTAPFTIQLYWQVLGQARFPNNFDRGFKEESHIFRVGTANAPALAPERLTTFTDPNSGITYGAIKYPDREGSGEAMLDRAACLSIIAEAGSATGPEREALQEAAVDRCAAFRGRDPGSVNFPNAQQARFELDSYRQLIQVVADIPRHMDFGDPYNP